jgi:sporulation protein YlmC with PRC-barrel domain
MRRESSSSRDSTPTPEKTPWLEASAIHGFSASNPKWNHFSVAAFGCHGPLARRFIMKVFSYGFASIALLLVAPMALAQQAPSPTPPAEAPPAIACPEPGSVPDTELTAECKEQLGATTGQPANPELTPAPNDSATAPAPADPMTTGSAASTAVETKTFLASQFMGQTVFTAAGENIGDVNDLVLSKDDNNILAIIGVGGFLGIGEKNVAVPVDKITVKKSENDYLFLTTSASKAELEAAPAFEQTAQNLQ